MSAVTEDVAWSPGLLATDFYQLTMLHAYRAAGMRARAEFEFFCRNLAPSRGFLVAAGLGTLLERLETLRFSGAELEWLRASGQFPNDMIEYFDEWQFTGNIDAVPEGTLVFAQEPMLRVEAPIGEAQLIETLVINHLHFQTLIASKAARMVLVAPQAQLIDFGLRRAHGLEAGLFAARASYLAGFAGTATAAAGQRFGIPVFGTMAHSFVQAHESEKQAFADFARARPDDTILLIDTYDTEAAAALVVEVAAELRKQGGKRIRGVRIDSGDLAAHASKVRHILDEGGLKDAIIVASGGIDEWELRKLIEGGAPIDSFGIGTSLTTSQDKPALDCAYKLVSYNGAPRRKRSEGKVLWPGAKQVFRHYDRDGYVERDILALKGEAIEGEPLLRPMMRGGRQLLSPQLQEMKATARANLERLPASLKDLDSATDYPVEVSVELRTLAAELASKGH
jgi:nicotinate phosphoribosyltransferase